MALGIVMTMAAYAIGTTGCKRLIKQTSTTVVAEPPAANDSEAQSFISRMQAGVAAKAIPQDIVDWDALIQRGLGETSMSPEFARGARKGAAERFISELNAVLVRGGTYRLLSNRLVNGQRRVRFRMVDSDGGFNYHDYVLVRGGKAVDLYVLLTGESMSTSVRRVMLPIVASQSRGLIERLTQQDNEFVKNFDKVQKLSSSKEDPKGALAAYASLPKSIQHDKSIMLLRINAASAVSETDYAAAIGDFRRLHPHDACVDVLSLDYYVLKQQYDQALEALGRIEKKEGTDPYLGVVRANLLFLRRDRPAAEQSLRDALAADPELIEGIRLLITADLADNNLTEASKLAASAQARSLPLGPLADSPAFTALLRTREYKAALRDSAAAPSASAAP